MIEVGQRYKLPADLKTNWIREVFAIDDGLVLYKILAGDTWIERGAMKLSEFESLVDKASG